MKRSSFPLQIYLLVVLGVLLATGSINAQKSSPSLLGNSGCILNPTARFSSDRTMVLSWASMPEKYQIITDKLHNAPENLLNFSLMFLPFMEVSAHIIQPVDIKENSFGIGDRSYKVRFLLFKEKDRLPSLALGIHDPISSNTRQGAVYLVLSKAFTWKQYHLDAHLGYGFDIQKPFWEKTHLFQEDGMKNQSHLKGIFGGVSASWKFLVLMAEYDTEKINAGLSASFFTYFQAGIYTLGFDRLSAQLAFSYRFGDPVL